jgi:hypothetical protein
MAFPERCGRLAGPPLFTLTPIPSPGLNQQSDEGTLPGEGRNL